MISIPSPPEEASKKLVICHFSVDYKLKKKKLKGKKKW